MFKTKQKRHIDLFPLIHSRLYKGTVHNSLLCLIFILCSPQTFVMVYSWLVWKQLVLDGLFIYHTFIHLLHRWQNVEIPTSVVITRYRRSLQTAGSVPSSSCSTRLDKSQQSLPRLERCSLRLHRVDINLPWFTNGIESADKSTRVRQAAETNGC